MGTSEVFCGQVLMDRQRHIAIVAKKDMGSVQLVGVRAGVLRLKKYLIREIEREWVGVDYPFDLAMVKLLAIGRERGITDGARAALQALAVSGKEPKQGALF